MPKLKTNKSAAKRFRHTASGKLKRPKAGGNHLLSHKTTKRKRHRRAGALVHEADEKRFKILMPYGGN